MLGKEGILKRYQQRVKQYRQIRTFQNKERKLEMTRKYSNNQTQEKLNDFYTQENIIKKSKRINNMAKEFERLEEGAKAKMHVDLQRLTKKYHNGKR